MATSRRLLAWLTAGSMAGAGAPGAPQAFTNVELGARLDNPRLARLEGGQLALLEPGTAVNLFVFFRPEQDHSHDALKGLARLQQELAGQPVRMVAVVSDAWTAEQVRATVAAAGFTAPVLIDAGDRLYGALGVRLHPVVGLADARLRLAAYEHYRRINFMEIVRGRIRVMLGQSTEAEMARVLEPEKATSTSPEAEARRHLNLARLLWKRGNAVKALESIRRSRAVLPSAAALALQGEITAAGGDCRAARPLFEQAVKIDPAEPVAVKGLQACARP